MTWALDGEALRGRVAVVAGATRGAGRGMAVALGEAGATVICTGRSSVRGRRRSDYDRPETIEETADLVTAAGGRGTALHVDRLRVAALRRAGRRCALAADPGRSRWNQQSVTSAELAGVRLHRHRRRPARQLGPHSERPAGLTSSLLELVAWLPWRPPRRSP